MRNKIVAFRTLLSSTFIVLYSCMVGQNLSAYTDKSGYFYAFSDGAKIKLESLPVTEYVVGGNSIGYVDNMGNFKIYYNGASKKMANYSYTKLKASRILLAYTMGSLLYVFDNGHNTKLSNWVKDFQIIGDSLITFYDETEHEFRIYYDGTIHTIFNDLGTYSINPFEMGDYILGFYDTDNYYSEIYKGRIQQLVYKYDIISVAQGQNVLAISSNQSPSFYAFHKGKLYELENAFPPSSYKVGIDMVAYIDNTGEFKAFYNGNVQTLSSFEPDTYDISDSVLVYSEQGYFKAFYDGKIYELENYLPSKFIVQGGNVAYFDQQNHVKLFRAGRLETISNEVATSFSIDYNVVRMEVGIGTTLFYYNDNLFNP